MCLLAFAIVLIIILVVLVAIYMQRTARINGLKNELDMMKKTVINEQMKNNETIETEKTLRNQIKDFQKQIGISKTFML